MTWYDKTYVIVDIVDITQDMIDECIESSIRKNAAETKAVLKWYSRDAMPATIAALVPIPTTYTKAEILIELDDADWQIEE